MPALSVHCRRPRILAAWDRCVGSNIYIMSRRYSVTMSTRRNGEFDEMISTILHYKILDEKRNFSAATAVVLHQSSRVTNLTNSCLPSLKTSEGIQIILFITTTTNTRLIPNPIIYPLSPNPVQFSHCTCWYFVPSLCDHSCVRCFLNFDLGAAFQQRCCHCLSQIQNTL